MRRTLAASALPALVIGASWLRLEDPRRTGEALVVIALALAPTLAPQGWRRAAVAALAALGAAWIVFGAQPWELLPFRDERVLGPALTEVGRGIEDFYAVFLPFDPERNSEMHVLVLMACFGFVLGAALLVASRRPVAAAAVTVAGAGWPATLAGSKEVAIGALALAAALSVPLVLRARSGPSLVVGAATALAVVFGAAWVSSATTISREAVLNWESWDIRQPATQASTVRLAWESNYDGINFPPTPTVVLAIEGPERARYWRTSTLDLFTDDHWLEDLLLLARTESGPQQLPLGQLTPARAALRENWLEQRVEVKALVDYHLAAAGTPVALDSGRLGTVFVFSGSILRVRDPVGEGKSYRIWSYAPEPAPAALAAGPTRYPSATARYLVVDGRSFPPFGTPDRERVIRPLFAQPPFLRHKPMYSAARRVAGRATSPYAAVLALESWFRQRGGFRYDESPPRVSGSPLVEFVTRTRAGYCQHFAGAMAAMLRMLGIPARVAVGFTSGKKIDGRWIVTDHNAHAWVEVWFARHGWIPFDPTPGRGTFAGDYSFASDSEAAVAALSRGELSRSTRNGGRLSPELTDLLSRGAPARNHAPSLFGLVLLLGAVWCVGIGAWKIAVRRVRYLTRDPRRVATATRRELEAFLLDQRIPIPPGATLSGLQLAVREELGLDGHGFAAAAAGARFGPSGDATTGARAARKELRLLLERARRELSMWSRFRGFVSLRSLRGERRSAP